jgi:hypothetical protein
MEDAMLRRIAVLGILLASAAVMAAQTQPMPQTARQALIEMFFSKTSGTFEKHLPQATVAAIHKSDSGSGPSMLSLFSMVSAQAHSNGHFESFEAGPMLFSSEDLQNHSKLEVMVERDDLQGESDEIELSFHAYKDGQLQTAGIDPRVVLVMQPEQKTWRLYDIRVTIGFSLTDPNFLKLLSTPVRPQVTGATTGVTANQNQFTPAATFGSVHASNEASATSSIRAINTAQVTYAAMYPAHGFTCTLSDLGGMGGGAGADEHHAMLVEPRLSNGRKNGYVFKLTNCNGSPATTYSVIATPTEANAGSRAFCSDQSGVVRSSTDAASCASSGQPVQ